MIDPLNYFTYQSGFSEYYLHPAGTTVILNNTLHLLTNKNYEEKLLIERIFFNYFYDKVSGLFYRTG